MKPQTALLSMKDRLQTEKKELMMRLAKMPDGSGELYSVVQGEGLSLGLPVTFVRLSGCNLQCNWCFVADTPILMEDGSEKLIQDILVDDMVMSYSETYGEILADTVVELRSHEVDGEIYNITFEDDRVLEVTGEHPFLTTMGWVKAEDLTKNDQVYLVDGVDKSELFVKNILRKHVNTTVYNFETKETHTYIANGIIVHNCDTAFTWNFEETTNKKTKYFSPVKMSDYVLSISPREVAEQVFTKMGKGVRRVVFSGGEPMLQQAAIRETIENLYGLFSAHRPKETLQVEIETNGTVPIQPETVKLINQINCSPKLESSGNLLRMREKPEAIRSILHAHDMGKKLLFKFVVMAESMDEDIKEIQDWAERMGVPHELIGLMPEGTEMGRIRSGMVKLEKRCVKDGFRLLPRLHVLMHGKKRAV